MNKTPKIKTLNHGRETYAVYYGDEFVLKRPLPTFGATACDAWLAKQHKTKDAIDRIRAVDNPLYNVPAMRFINDDEYQILEERAPGVPLTSDVYRTLSRRQRYEIINSLASFLVDMNESQPIGTPQPHKIASELKFARLDNFIETKMPKWFNKNEVRQMSRIRDQVALFQYTTRMAWSHCDLNPGNVLYDAQTSKISFIDFAEAGYRFIYRDIFASLQIELGIWKQVYDAYLKMHDKSLWSMPSAKNENLREIMKYRLITIILKRFIKASDDLRQNPQNDKGARNNIDKVAFMRDLMQNLQNLERSFQK